MREEDVRNVNILDRYLELVERDVASFFDISKFVTIKCPACYGTDLVHEFDKGIFKYVSCKTCSTLFVNPRPPYEVLKKFYSDAPSSNFWVNSFFKPVAEARREKIFRPRAEYIQNILNGKNRLAIGDIGAGFGLFLEELKKISPDNTYIAIEPSLDMAKICKRKKIEVKCACLEDIDEKTMEFDLLTAFELTEHLFDPASFLRKAYSLLKKDGYLFMTTLNGMGFDILLLWEKSRSVNPPHHLNFFNTSSLKRLLEDTGFTIVDISTPGALDWDITEGMIRKGHISVSRFWDRLAYDGSNSCKKELQDWISRNKMSSHMQILVKK